MRKGPVLLTSASTPERAEHRGRQRGLCRLRSLLQREHQAAADVLPVCRGQRHLSWGGGGLGELEKKASSVAGVVTERDNMYIQ